MRIPLYWWPTIAAVVVVGVILNMIAYVLPGTSIAALEIGLIALSARFYLVYSYRSIVPRPKIARHATLRAAISALIGSYCLILIFWNVWSTWNGGSSFIPPLSVPLILVLYSLLQEHERTDIRKALQINAARS